MSKLGCGDLAGVGWRDGELKSGEHLRRLRLEELRIETGLRLHMNPGAILEPAAILLQSVNGTAEGPVLVLYTPAVLFIDCTGIAVGLGIGSGLCNPSTNCPDGIL